MMASAPGWTFPQVVLARGSRALEVPWMIQAALLAFVFLIPLETLGHESETSSLTVSRLVGMALAGSCLFRPRLLLRWPDR